MSRTRPAMQEKKSCGPGGDSVDIKKQWQEARANRRMQFKVGNYRVLLFCFFLVCFVLSVPGLSF